MKRLEKWELELLPVSLITPLKFARQVKKRNEALLKALEDGLANWSGRVGCPHCIEAKKKCMESGWLIPSCDYCRWSVSQKAKYIATEFCLKHKFGNVLYSDVSVRYHDGSECLVGNLTYDNTKKFLKGHIRWADRIIDGTYAEYAEKHGIKKAVRVDGKWVVQE